MTDKNKILGKLFFDETDKVVFSYKGREKKDGQGQSGQMFFKFNSHFLYHAQIKVL